MTDNKGGHPRKHEVKGGAQTDFEKKKKASGAKMIGFYMKEDTISALEYWKNITGFGPTEIINRVLANSKQRPKLFLDLIQFDFDKYYETALALATQRAIDNDYGIDDGGMMELSSEELEVAIAENIKLYGHPKKIGK